METNLGRTYAQILNDGIVEYIFKKFRNIKRQLAFSATDRQGMARQRRKCLLVKGLYE